MTLKGLIREGVNVPGIPVEPMLPRHTLTQMNMLLWHARAVRNQSASILPQLTASPLSDL